MLEIHAATQSFNSMPAFFLLLFRYPYSFLGDDRSGRGTMKGAPIDDGTPAEPLTETWHDALLGYASNNPHAREQVTTRRNKSSLGNESGLLAFLNPCLRV